MLEKSNDIVADVQKILRMIFQIQEPLSISPTARKFQLLQQLNDEQELVDQTSKATVDRKVLSESDVKISHSIVKNMPTTESVNSGNASDSGTVCPSQRNLSLEGVIRKSMKSSFPPNVADEEEKKLRSIKSYLGEDRFREEFVDTNKYSKADAEKLVSDIRLDQNTSDIATLGHDLSANVREILRYRIRKKRWIAGVARKLASRYYALSSNGKDANVDYGDLLPDVKEDKELRKAKIRELLEEVRGDNKVFSGKEEEILTAASAVSKRWYTKGVAL